MADEIVLNINLSCENGSYLGSFNPGQQEIDQAAIGAHDVVQNIGTSMEALVFGDLSVPGVTALQNLDTTNYIDIGLDVGGFQPLLRLLPGRSQMVQFTPGSTPQAKANSAACKLRKFSLET